MEYFKIDWEAYISVRIICSFCLLFSSVFRPQKAFTVTKLLHLFDQTKRSTWKRLKGFAKPNQEAVSSFSNVRFSYLHKFSIGTFFRASYDKNWMGIHKGTGHDLWKKFWSSIWSSACLLTSLKLKLATKKVFRAKKIRRSDSASRNRWTQRVCLWQNFQFCIETKRSQRNWRQRKLIPVFVLS